MKLASFQVDWLRNFLTDSPSTKDLLLPVSIHCDYQAVIIATKNKSYNYKGQNMKLKHDVIKQLFRDGIISIDFVKSKLNLANLLTKPIGRKLILQIIKEMGLGSTSYQ